MTHPLIERVGELVDARYAEVREALDLLDRHLRRGPAVPGRRSIRDAVLGELRDGERTVEEIAAATGLRKRQVRGVLYARDLAGAVVRKRERGGVMYYCLADPQDGET